MESLNINTQVALYHAFSTNIPEEWTLDPIPTTHNLAEISEESANSLYEFYDEELDKFICLPPAVKATLNEKFQELKGDTFETSYDLDAGRHEYATIQGKNPGVWYQYFRNNEDAWCACGIRNRDALNNLFETTEGLSPLPVPMLLMGPQKQGIFGNFFG